MHTIHILHQISTRHAELVIVIGESIFKIAKKKKQEIKREVSVVEGSREFQQNEKRGLGL